MYSPRSILEKVVKLTKNLSVDDLCVDQDVNPGPLNGGVLITAQQHLVLIILEAGICFHSHFFECCTMLILEHSLHC